MHQRPGNPAEDTVPIPLMDPVATGVPDAPPPHVPEASPVFVDVSGRRQRRVRRVGRLLVVPAAAYVVLLISTLLGGPTVQSPFLPSAQAPQGSQGNDPAAGSSTPSPSIGSAANGRTRPSPSGARSGAPATGAPGRTATSGTGAGPTAAPVGGQSTSTTLPSTANTARGRSSSAPGQGGKPTAHP